LFYQRPYEDLLPVEYRSESLYRKIKICYMAYFNSINTLYKNIDNFNFLKNAHIVFYPCDDEVQYEKRNHWIGCLIGAHKILNVGYPMLDRYLKIGDSSIDTTILWTPRWTPELKSGGSNFLRYKDKFADLRNNYEKAYLIARPHPLTFNNFISSGLLTEEEAEEYKSLLKRKQIELDESEDTFTAFQRASILISDYSSVILPFFLTGKPVIYCTVIGATGLEFTSEFKEVIKTLYIAESWDDVTKYVEMIVSGNDYLKESRQRIIKEKYTNKRNSTKSILNIIHEDYYED
jgi:CDP-glycerol glycerophosphotransferase (TagB/SpsB family)